MPFEDYNFNLKERMMQMKNMSKTAIIYAILAAALYAINIPLSKLLLNNIPPTLMAGFL